MKLIEKRNQKFVGAENRISLLDTIYPESQTNLPVVIFMHGFKGFKDWGCFPLFVREIATHNYFVLSFNFSHNGGTSDDAIDFPDLEAFSSNTYSKELEDIDHVFQWLIKQEGLKHLIDISSISLIGHSRGGAMALIAASKYKWVEKVITLAAVSDLGSRLPEQNEIAQWKENGVRYIKNARTKQSMPIKYSFVEDLQQNSRQLNVRNAIKSLAIPQFIIHGEEDEAVDVKSAYDLHSWGHLSTLKIIANTTHTFGGKHPWLEDELPEAMQEVAQWITQFLES